MKIIILRFDNRSLCFELNSTLKNVIRISMSDPLGEYVFNLFLCKRGFSSTLDV